MTLTEAAHWTKKLAGFFVAGFILFIVLVIILINRSKPQQLPKYQYADFACTTTAEEFKRHKLEIPAIEYTLEASENAFILETQTGRVEQLPDIINVYKYDNPGQYLTVQDDAKTLAKNLAFEPTKMQRIGTTAYKWADSFDRTLTVQARNLTFELTTDFSNPKNKPSGELPTDEDAKKLAREILNDYLNQDYLREIPDIMHITIEPNGTFREAKYKQEADLVRVDFVRKASMITIPSNISGADDLKNMLEKRLVHESTEEDTHIPGEGSVTLYKFDTWVTSLDPAKTLISVYIGPSNTDISSRAVNRVYGIDYKNWIIDPQYCGTYKLLDPAEVLTYVMNQEASLVYLNQKDGDKVKQDGTKNVRSFRITNIHISYYDAPREQDFLQPVYEVTGEATFTNGTVGPFIFYYPAIDYDAIQDSMATETPVVEE